MAGKKGRSGRPRKYPKPSPEPPKPKSPEKKPAPVPARPPIITRPTRPMILPNTGGESLNVNIPKSTPESGVEGLSRLQQEIKTGIKPDDPANAAQAAASPGAEAEAGEQKKKTKFKTYRPEQTVRMVVRQYWRFRDWMARRQLGLPSEYAGVFIQKEDGLVTPLVDPLIGCIDTYCPEEWIVFIEEKSPIIHLCLAVFEVEQVFQSSVTDAKNELARRNPKSQEAKPAEESRHKFPSLSETEGKR